MSPNPPLSQMHRFNVSLPLFLEGGGLFFFPPLNPDKAQKTCQNKIAGTSVALREGERERKKE